MDAITELNNLDFMSVILGIFIILSAYITIYEIICKVCDIFKKPVGKYKEREKDHKLIIENAKAIKELTVRHEEDVKESNKNDEIIRQDLENLTDMFLRKEISDIRWEIIDFSSGLSGGRKYNIEAFRHIFSLHEDYEKILAKNNMTNGLVDENMAYIRDKYRELLNNGELK